MTTAELATLHEAIDRLSPSQLEALKAFLRQLQPPDQLPIYRIHEHAVDAGVADLAERHDHYLYGSDANGSASG